MNKLNELLKKLEAKYSKDDQKLEVYLEALLHSDYINYWDYIKVDNLLNLQKPVTQIPDEMVFIMYHQITELYFKLSLLELNQIAENKTNTPEFMIQKIKRVTAYFQNLTNSFGIMIHGMDPEQFLKFRIALTPASGFQSAQYRLIEIICTDLIQLVHPEYKQKLENAGIKDQLDKLYWKWGATDANTGKKTLTLLQFENKYNAVFLEQAKKYKKNNIWQKYLSLSKKDRQIPELINAMKSLDSYINVKWPKVHLKSAEKYLGKHKAYEKATGGTNWKKYLPPQIQKRIFYPALWNKEDLENWG